MTVLTVRGQPPESRAPTFSNNRFAAPCFAGSLRAVFPTQACADQRLPTQLLWPPARPAAVGFGDKSSGPARKHRIETDARHWFDNPHGAA